MQPEKTGNHDSAKIHTGEKHRKKTWLQKLNKAIQHTILQHN